MRSLINGRVTSFKYDGLGREVSATLPSGEIVNTFYEWGDEGNTYPYNGGFPLGSYIVRKQFEQSGYKKNYFDNDSRLLRTETQDAQGQEVVKDTKFKKITDFEQYPIGTVLLITEPHYIGQPKYLLKKPEYETTYFRLISDNTYTVNGGSIGITNFNTNYTYNSPSTDAQYNQKFITATNSFVQVRKEYNSAGQLSLSRNTYAGLQQFANYSYNSNAMPKTISVGSNADPTQIVTSFSYNSIGQRTLMNEPNSGTYTYTYSSVGELLEQNDPNGTTVYTYDQLGRVFTESRNVSGTKTYQYVTSGNGNQKISKITGPSSVTEFTYDNLDRMIEKREAIDTHTFTVKYDLDKFGRTVKQTSPSGYVSKYAYNSFGFLQSIKTANDQVIWQLTSTDALGRITEFVQGNGLVTKYKFDDLNFLQEINYGNNGVFIQQYEHEYLFGRLTSRTFQNVTNNYTNKESFSFDQAERLNIISNVDPITNNVLQTNQISYDSKGNITQKYDAGSYAYGNQNQPYQLTQVNNLVGNNISLNTLNISYNDFRKVLQISEPATNRQFNFEYGCDDQRLKMEMLSLNQTQYTRYYTDNYDREETNSGYREWSYIFAPTGLCAVYFNSNGTGQLLYLLNDHLGSPVLLTNQSQQIIEENSFDSWGRRRNPANWTYNNIPPSNFMIRGFTLHEHIDEVGIINMNGRLYDPVLGRFIQVDNVVQSPDNLQNFNRYSYALNNPITYTDPDGNVFGIDDAVLGLIGGVINLATNWNHISNFGQGAAYFGVGFVSGALTEYISPIGSAALMGAGDAALTSYYQTGKVNWESVITEGLISAGFGALTFGVGEAVSPYLGKALSGVASPVLKNAIIGGGLGLGLGALGGGVSAAINGESFWQGAGEGALWGFGIGATTGAYQGYRYAKVNEISPWTGRYQGQAEYLEPAQVSIPISDNPEPNLRLNAPEAPPSNIEYSVEFELDPEYGTASTIYNIKNMSPQGFMNMVPEAQLVPGKINLWKTPDGAYFKYSQSTSNNDPTIYYTSPKGVITKLRFR